nr:hypothetical protein [Eubacterium sp.]
MYKKAGKGWLKHLDFVILELISLHLGLFLSAFLRYGTLFGVYESLLYRNIAVVASFVLIFVIAWTNTFSGVLKRGYEKEIINALKTSLYVMAVLALYLFAIHQGGDFSRLVYVGMGAFYFCFASLFRCLRKYTLRVRGVNDDSLSVLYLVSTTDRAAETLEGLSGANGINYKISGVILVDRTHGDGSKAGDGTEAGSKAGEITEIAGFPV